MTVALSTTPLAEAIATAADAVRSRFSARPDAAIILGTGLGALAAEIDVKERIAYSSIPGFALPTVVSHEGWLLCGTLAGKTVIAMQGRFHRYEGLTLQQVTFPVRVLRALGAGTLIVSNACGCMNPDWRAGDLMVIDDHINLLGDNPLIGANDDGLGPRFPDMSEPYSVALRRIARDIAHDRGITLREGVYVAVTGPNLETRAEYRMLRGMGADVVGMSTVPEVIVAVHAQMRVLGISIVTDMCIPGHLQPAKLEDILAVAASAEPRLTLLVRRRAGADVAMARYREIDAATTAHALEEEVLARWRAEKTFEQVQEARVGGEPFVFFEGPPTANGRPGIHHVFSRTVKDLICRHRTMRGHYVPRKAGWDTHGLPVEIEVEKALNISGKQDIERLGVAEFNKRCRDSVFTYRSDWEKLSERIAYWLDYEKPYVTYFDEYVESVWWALRKLYDRNLLYRGHKILPYCARCGTALSSHEVAQGYEDVEDPSVYIGLDLVGATGNGQAATEVRRRILVWTTTPWTLVSNAALAVHPDLPYVELRKRPTDGAMGSGQRATWTVLLAEARVQAVLGEGWSERWEEVARFTGHELAGQRYKRPLDWLPYPANTEHEIIVAEDFVSADDGTGVVHMSPAFGADDYAAGKRHNLGFLQPVDARGRFPEDMPLIGGKFVKDADDAIIGELERRDVLWKAGKMVHSYPHCWRCGTPLLYYARTSWFVRTTAYKDRMLARNARVDWHPEEIGAGRFGEWLENNVDWAISRDRYWGTPLPVWVNDQNPDEIEVVGSYAELEQKSGRTRGADFDPHKPFIDEFTWPAPSGKGTMRRVPEVIDTWFDSGSMPFAQWHYPFENADMIRAQYPADYIAEAVDQTRGWFYSLLAIATGLADDLPHNEDGQAAPYRAVIVNDFVRDAQGQKMSKSRGNAVDPWAVIERHGADATRLFLVASSNISLPRNFDEQAIRDFAGRFLVTLRNTYSGMFAQYANFGWAPGKDDPAPSERQLVDRWVLSRLAAVEAEAHERLQGFDPTGAARVVMDFVTNDVSLWYVRQNRSRFYETTSADNKAAFATLHEVLVVVCRLLAPFCPFLCDFIHRELTGSSVHLAHYVRGNGQRVTGNERDEALEYAMNEIRELARLGRAAREKAGINVRKPLSEVVCVAEAGNGHGATGSEALAQLTPLLARELNVKRVTFAASSDALVTLTAKPNFRGLGKIFGKHTNEAAAAVRALGSEQLLSLERGGDVRVTAGGETHPITLDDLTIERHAAGSYVVEHDGVRFAAIDPTVSEALRAEGIAREIVSRIQRMRKDLGFAVSDRVELGISGDAAVEAAALTHESWIGGEVLATQVRVGSNGPAASAPEVDVDGMKVRISLTRTA